MDLLISLLLATAVQFLLFLYLRGRIEQQLKATDLLKNVQTEIDSMVRELNLSAERNIGVLEQRLSEMEGLLGKADQKVMLLQRELDRRDRATETYAQMRRPLPEPESIPAVALEVAVVPEPVPVPVPEPIARVEVPPPPKSLKQKVLEYRAAGRSPNEIATLTGATQGEVELILSLQQSLFAQESIPSG